MTQRPATNGGGMYHLTPNQARNAEPYHPGNTKRATNGYTNGFERRFPNSGWQGDRQRFASDSSKHFDSRSSGNRFGGGGGGGFARRGGGVFCNISSCGKLPSPRFFFFFLYHVKLLFCICLLLLLLLLMCSSIMPYKKPHICDSFTNELSVINSTYPHFFELKKTLCTILFCKSLVKVAKIRACYR